MAKFILQSWRRPALTGSMWPSGQRRRRIPVVGPFRLDLLANNVQQITAIINGTANYSCLGWPRASAQRTEEPRRWGMRTRSRNDVEGIDA